MDFLLNFVSLNQGCMRVLTPIILGVIVGFVAALIGVGGAFLMVPAMIYLIGMPVKLIPGTSLFVTVFISISYCFTCV